VHVDGCGHEVPTGRALTPKTDEPIEVSLSSDAMSFAVPLFSDSLLPLYIPTCITSVPILPLQYCLHMIMNLFLFSLLVHYFTQTFQCHFFKAVKEIKEMFLTTVFSFSKFHISPIIFKSQWYGRSCNTVNPFPAKFCP
jgi:hypothetical protein